MLFSSYTPPIWGKFDREMRRRRAEMLYEFETALRDMGETSEFVYDEEHALYRFKDGEFAFSREYANERRLREAGFIG